MKSLYKIALWIVVLLTLCICKPVTSLAAPVDGNIILYDQARLDFIRENAYADEMAKSLSKNIIYDADWHMKVPIVSVVEKTVIPQGGTVHDYVSLSRYYWPNPDRADGLPYIKKDGETNPERMDLTKYDAVKMEKMFAAVDSLSVAYYITGQEKYAERAVVWLQTWFVNQESRMNPNLNYGQGIPGKSDGTQSGIIETAQIVRLVDAATMLENYSGWAVEDKRIFKKWLSDYLNWLIASPLGLKERVACNNHGVWYDVQIAALSYYLGEHDWLLKVLNETVPQRIQTQIQTDGAMPLEMARTRSMHYVLYNLEAFITLARLGDKVNINLWDFETFDGRGVKKAIEYVQPYILGEKQWQYQIIVAEKENSAARYFAMAEEHYHSSDFAIAAINLLGKTKGREELAVKTFLHK